jgi:peptidoglycan biosynthesis protein MviN/MurJ (putative lipid II flippase)
MDNKKFNFSSLMTIIVIVGVLISFLSEVQPWQIFDQQVGEEMAGQPIEFMLDELNMILMGIAFAGLIIFLFVRAALKDRNSYKDWE